MVFVKNVNLSLTFCQGIFMIFGIWPPQNLNNISRYFYLFYSIVSLFLYIGVYIIIQFGDLIQVWGNLPLIAASVFLLFTNFVLGIKVVNVIINRKVIEDMLSESNEELTNENRKEGIILVESCNKDNTRLLIVYFSWALLSVFGLMSSAEKNQLPLRAWYPYNTSKTPAYQLTYAHQIIALSIAAAINVAFDILVTSLIAQFRCRLSLLALSLRTLCEGLHVSNKGLLTQFSELIISDRLERCVVCHQAVLEQVKTLKNCFATPILAQFSISVLIICVTAYQLAFFGTHSEFLFRSFKHGGHGHDVNWFKMKLWKENINFFRIISMVVYLTVMMMQVFIYCNGGNQLVTDSEGVSSAAYESFWYTYSVSIRRSLLILMSRTRRPARVTVGGITELSLATFMAIIKASYTFLTVLQQVEE